MLNKLIAPKSVAVIGAAREKGKVGHVVLENILKAGYKGSLYAVNPKAKKILGIKSYPTINDIKARIDLAVIVTPAKIVPDLIRQCGEKGVGAAIIISAGFKESSLEGAQLEKKALEIAKKYKMRILGPNCLGLINSQIGLNASFTRIGPRQGNIAFISQSGALQTAVLDWSIEAGIGFSKFVSLGNKSDLNETDFLQALARDSSTSVICLYLEAISDGPRFIKIASKIALNKPIIALKAGRTSAGARAVSSHTGSLAGSSRAYTAAFTQAAVIQANSLEQLIIFASVLANQPLPKGNRLGILTNAGGPAIMASDYASSSALSVASLTSKTVKSLSSFLPQASNIYNPVDVLGDAKADRYRKAFTTLIKDKNVDNLLVILTPQAMTEIKKTAELVSSLAKKSNKPVIPVFMGGMEVKDGAKILAENGLQNFIYPETAVKAIGSLVTYSKIRKRAKADYKEYKINRKKINSILETAKTEQRVNLSYVEANEILKATGIAVPQSYLARNVQETVNFAKRINFPIALKIVSPDILHKTDIGGVKLNLGSDAEVSDGYQVIMTNIKKFMPEANIQGILVQEMITDGDETIVGVSVDPQFGPLMVFGLGGIFVEILKDVSFRIAPVSTEDVKKMLGEVKSYLLLKGVRGRKPRDVKAVEETILRVSQLVSEYKEIVEMDINPLMVKDEDGGVVAADVRMSISLK